MLKKNLKLLELWEKPHEAGDAIGCLCTSFTFDSGEFEEECLSRFLHLNSDGKEEKIIQLLELETQLQQIGTVTVFVDAHNASGIRSPRWTIAPVHLKGAVFHPKIQLLVWSQWVRIIIGSANLSLSGLRNNTELAVTFDYSDELPADLKFIKDVLEYFKNIAKKARFSEKCRNSVNILIDKANALVSSFKLNKPIYPYFFVPVLPMGESVFKQINNIKKRCVFDCVFVESPSFDMPETKNEPAEKIWSLLSTNRKVEVIYNLQGSKGMNQESYDLVAPESLICKTKKNQNIKVKVFEAIEAYKNRNLHSKILAFKGDKKCLLMIGSSNFSTLGLGLKKKSNFEANVAFLFKKNRTTTRFINEILLPSKEIDICQANWIPKKTVDPAESISGIPFPDFIESIIFNSNNDKTFYTISFEDNHPEFEVLNPEGYPLDAKKEQQDNKLLLSLEPNLHPHSDLKIKWDGKTALFPVNIESQDAIPAPEYLKNISFEDIVNLLKSNLPIQKKILKFLKNKMQKNLKYNGTLNPLDLVDTSKYILQKTRQFSKALSLLKSQIEGNLSTIEQLKWRLTGPLGFVAVKDALLKFFTNSDERTFFLAEMIGELYNLTISETNILNQKEINDEVQRVIAQLESELSFLSKTSSKEMKKYIQEKKGNLYGN